MRMRRGFYAFGAVAAALGLALILVWGLQRVSPVAAAGAETLKNDSWAPGQSLAFMDVFLSGDIVASRLVPSDTSEVQVTSVLFMFGPAPGTQTITMIIWEDSGGTADPGAVLFSGSYQVTASSDAMQVIDLSGENVTVSGTFRVGIEFTHNGAPSVARDVDGITVDRNFVNLGSGWVDASTYSVPGDWIIRATVEGVDDTPPEVLSTLPISGAVDVALAAPVVITFSEPIDTGIFTYTVAPDPGGWSGSWSGDATVVTLTHSTFAYATTYTVTVAAADDLAGNPLLGGPYAWRFETVPTRAYLPLVMREAGN